MGRRGVCREVGLLRWGGELSVSQEVRGQGGGVWGKYSDATWHFSKQAGPLQGE